MADEEDPWAFDDAGDSEPKADASPAPPAPASAAAASAVASETASLAAADVQSTGGGAQESAGEAVAQEEAAPPPPPPEDDGYRKPVQLYRHWVRPKFLQYKYMYNYRTNYYDDVIDYLDKKSVGVTREIPRPQTWAERVLRTNNSVVRDLDMYTASGKREHQLVQTLAASIRGYNYHTKAYLNQKYGHVI